MRAETGSSLAGLIDRELRLPEIDGEACVHAQIEQAHCSACVEACPRGAWVLDEDALGLDTEACDGCGLCIPDCPTGALHIHMPWVVRLLGGNPIALFACEHSEARVDQASLRSRERFWDIRVPKIDSIFDNSLVPRPSWSPGVPPQHRKLVAATHRSPI